MSRRHRRKLRRYGQINLQKVDESQNIDFSNNIPQTDSTIDTSERNQPAQIKLETNTHIYNNKNSLVLGIVAIAAGVLLIASGYIALKYFNNSQVTDVGQEQLANVEIENSNDEGKISEEAARNDSTVVNDIKDAEIKPVIAENTAPVVSQWKANHYNKGDIKPDNGKYTVKAGDTLWEISQGLTGSGANWHQIAQANNITNLSNGNPLITPGQVLTL